MCKRITRILCCCCFKNRARTNQFQATKKKKRKKRLKKRDVPAGKKGGPEGWRSRRGVRRDGVADHFPVFFDRRRTPKMPGVSVPSLVS